MSALKDRSSRPLRSGEGKLGASELERLMAELSGWQVTSDGKELERAYAFPDFLHTMAFVNALASIAHTEDHHPDFAAGYNYCRVRFSTHSAGGVTENDLICAAKLDALWGAGPSS